MCMHPFKTPTSMPKGMTDMISAVNITSSLSAENESIWNITCILTLFWHYWYKQSYLCFHGPITIFYLPDMTRVLSRLHPAVWISLTGRLFLMAALIILLPLMSSWKFSSCLERSTRYSSASATQSSKSTMVAMYSITFNTFPSFGTGP